MKASAILTIILVSASYTQNLALSKPGEGASAGSEKEKTAIKAFMSQKALAPVEYLLLVGNSKAKDIDELRSSYQSFLLDISKFRKSEKSQKRILSALFYKVHRKYLKSYQELASFSELIADGSYNCLTGTALYALALNELNINYEIIERKYHIYLKVATDEGEILIESTDPINGFITSAKEIAERLAGYDEEQNGKAVFAYTGEVNNAIDLYQMVGLHYYNAAIKHFNKLELRPAYVAVQKALIFYESERLKDFRNLIGEAYAVGRRVALNDIKGD